MEEKFFAECGDCGHKAATAEAFSDHAHACKVKPILWKPTADYVARRRERDAAKAA